MKKRILIDTVNSLVSADPVALIRDEENKYHKSIKELSDRLCEGELSERRVIFLAGPSGSGKTTTANLVSDALRAKGKSSCVVSLDMFYHERDSFPIKEDGTRDYENVSAIDTDEIKKCISSILDGKTYKLCKYDFSVQKRTEQCTELALNDGGYIIVEGIHALNPVLKNAAPKELSAGVFVSVSNGYSLDGKTEAVSGKDLRFIRRLCRDHIYRGSSADNTLSMWEDVLCGENKYLYPYKSSADVAINTFHAYEAGLMKSFVAETIGEQKALLYNTSPLIRRILDFFEHVTAVDGKLVPQNSLLREFCGGGIYSHLH